jgi:hypothetical protein
MLIFFSLAYLATLSSGSEDGDAGQAGLLVGGIDSWK